MVLKLQNVAKIKETCDIKFNGITLIAGKNNTGKSTISKVLYCIFDSLFNLDEKIFRKKKDDIYMYARRTLGVFYEEDEIFTDEFYSSLIIEKDLNKSKNILKKNIIGRSDINDESIAMFFEKINNFIINVNDEQFKNVVVENNFLNEFDNQIRSVYNNEIGIIDLLLKNNKISISFNNEKFNVDNEIKIKHSAYYFDGPNIIDNCANRRVLIRRYDFDHQSKIYYNIKNYTNQTQTIEEITNHNYALSIFKKYFYAENEQNLLNINFGKNIKEFDSINAKGGKEPLNVKRLSNGLKTISILQNLFSKSIVEEDILILDEPEINLHPEWQIKLAELLVELQMQFKLTILLSTHSPYFINAIDTFSYKYNISDKCNYYFSTNNLIDNIEYSFINDASDNIDLIYNMLSQPFEKLMNERMKIFDDKN